MTSARERAASDELSQRKASSWRHRRALSKSWLRCSWYSAKNVSYSGVNAPSAVSTEVSRGGFWLA